MILLLLCILLPFAVEMFVEWVNLQYSQNQEVPNEFRNMLSAEENQKSRTYQKENAYFYMLSGSFQTLILILFLTLGGYGLLDRWIASFSDSKWHSIAYIFVLGFLSSFVSLPFSFYHVFHIEQKYGFNRTTLTTFITDRIKGWGIAVILGAPLLYMLQKIFFEISNYAWIYAWVFLVIVQTLLLFLAPAVLMPLFNKFEPMPDNSLRKLIDSFARKQNLALKGIFQMDGSKRSAKANAFFTGFGKFRRIVLFDTLISKLSEKETLAVLAHEIGHLKRGHILKQLALSYATSFGLFWAIFQVLKWEELQKAMGFTALSFHGGILCAMLLFGPLQWISSLFSSALSRRFEYEADQFAKEQTGCAEDLASALKKLSVDHYSNLTPHPWKVWLEYSHPTTLQRIKALRGN